MCTKQAFSNTSFSNMCDFLLEIYCKEAGLFKSGQLMFDIICHYRQADILQNNTKQTHI